MSGLIRRKPFSELLEDLDRTTSDFMQNPGGLFGNFLNTITPFPSVEVHDENGQLVVRAEVPGMKKEDISVEITDGVLTISGERKTEKKTNIKSEISYGKFSRSFGLPEDIDVTKVFAENKNGILEIKIARKEIAKKSNSSKVEIQGD